MGSIVALSYIAAQRTFPNYNDMADNKAYLESIARSFGYYMGKDKKVRVNNLTVPDTYYCRTRSERIGWLFDLCGENLPLGNATASECADDTVMMFSDLHVK